MDAESSVDLNPSTWVDEHGNALYRHALTMVKDPGTAEELVQEAFLAALQSIDRYRGKSDPRGWLYGILRHKIYDYFRRRSRSREQLEGDDDALEHQLFDARGGWTRPPAALPRDPHEILSDEHFRRTLKQCLDRLPEMQRSVLLLRCFEELSAGEICKLFDISTTNLWVLLHRARNGTRQCLEQEWIDRGTR